jgi:branched-chain amino acid transport system substrate-binding protein
VAKGLAAKAIDDEAFAVFGPVFSGSIMVSMAETQRAEVPNFTGGEAAAITQQGNPYIFRTSFTQASAMPKVAKYIAGGLKAKTVAVMYVNNDFGKGGRDAITKALEANGVKVVADISTDSGQVDFSAAVLKAKQPTPMRCSSTPTRKSRPALLRELRKQGYTKPIVGETTLTGQKVIELAGDAANGALAHVGLTVDARKPADAALQGPSSTRRQVHLRPQRHQGLHRRVRAQGRHREGRQARPQGGGAGHEGPEARPPSNPGILMDVSFDDKGDLDRESFLVEVKNGRQVVKEVLPPLSKK